MTYPFVYDDDDEERAKKKSAQAAEKERKDEGARLSAAAPPLSLIGQCILAKERAAANIQWARNDLAREINRLKRPDTRLDEAEAKETARHFMSELRGKSTAEMLRLAEQRTLEALQERSHIGLMAEAKSLEAQGSASESDQARRRVLDCLIKQSAGEEAVKVMSLERGWAWRHLSKDVSKAVAPHVRDELGREQYYYFREAQVVAAQAKEASGEERHEHDKEAAPTVPPRRRGY